MEGAYQVGKVEHGGGLSSWYGYAPSASKRKYCKGYNQLISIIFQIVS